MLNEFKAFLIKQNALALAIAVVIAGALDKVIKAIVDGLIMPIVAVAVPNGAWQEAKLRLGPFVFGTGLLAAALINFLIIGFVAWRLAKLFIRSDVPPARAIRTCPFCQMGDLDALATRCPHCTSELSGAGGAPRAQPRQA
jgi:large conductance mechanosensitive channel